MIVSGNSFLLLTHPRPLQLDSFDNCCKSKAFEQLICRKALRFVLLNNYFHDTIFSLKSKFGIESLSSLVQDVFFTKVKQGFKKQRSWYTFFRAPNNMLAYKIMHFTFRAPQIVVFAHVYANVNLAVHLLQRQKYFRVKLNLFHSPSTQNLD